MEVFFKAFYRVFLVLLYFVLDLILYFDFKVFFRHQLDFALQLQNLELSFARFMVHLR